MSNEPLSPPPAAWTLLESRAPLEGLSLLASLPWLATAPRGDGHSVLIAPGFGAGEVSVTPMVRFLERLGYAAGPWGLGRNGGQVMTYVEALVERLSSRSEPPISLIGWSLGGVIVREVARELPDRVRQVITLGSPVVGGPKYTRVGNWFWGSPEDLDRLEAQIHERNLRGIHVPVTSIYSRTDGVVAWRASVDHYNAHAVNLPVPGSHLGLGVNPVVWRHLAKLLARPGGGPRPG